MKENEHGYSRNSKKPSGKHPTDGKDITKKEWKPSDSLRERIAEYAMGAMRRIACRYRNRTSHQHSFSCVERFLRLYDCYNIR